MQAAKCARACAARFVASPRRTRRERQPRGPRPHSGAAIPANTTHVVRGACKLHKMGTRRGHGWYGGERSARTAAAARLHSAAWHARTLARSWG